MEIRYFQIIIPIVALVFIYFQYRDFVKNKSGFYETALSVIFWIGIVNLALFPDFFSRLIAKVFGIKNNINAIIFFALGLLFYFQLKMYKTIKKQDELLTELTRKIALDNYKKN
jgi:hypothetical protein